MAIQMLLGVSNVCVIGDVCVDTLIDRRFEAIQLMLDGRFCSALLHCVHEKLTSRPEEAISSLGVRITIG